MILSVGDVVKFSECPTKLWYRITGLRVHETPTTLLGKAAHKLRARAAILHSREPITTETLMEEAKKIATEYDIPPRKLYTIAHKIAKILQNHRPKNVMAEVYLEAQPIGLRGVVDLIEDHTIVEIKLRTKERPQDRLQLALYAILLEYNEIPHSPTGILELLALPQRIPIPITRQLKNHALQKLHQAHHAINTLPEEPPPNTKHCHECEYKPICTLKKSYKHKK